MTRSVYYKRQVMVVLDALAAFQYECGRSPTLAELAARVGLPASQVHARLCEARHAGFIDWPRYASGAYRFVKIG